MSGAGAPSRAPDWREQLDGLRRRAGEWSPRGLLLYVLPLPLFPAFLASLVRADLPMLALEACVLLCFLWGAALARRGLRVEAAYRRRRVARPPRLPRKTLGAALISLGVFVAAKLGAAQPTAVALGMAGGSLAGFFLAYGFDPQRVKSVPAGPYGLTGDEIVAALEEANAAIERIEAAHRRIRQPELSRRLRHIADLARGIVELIEDDPRDLRRARKFLNVYLTGARKVAEGYARAHRLRQSRELEASFRNVLVTIEDVFREQRERLLDRDEIDLDVQIEVLASQLRREGVT